MEIYVVYEVLLYLYCIRNQYRVLLGFGSYKHIVVLTYLISNL